MVQGFPVTSTLTDTAFQEHVPKVKGEHGRAWILGGPRKSASPEMTQPQPVPILREPDLHRSQSTWLLRATDSHPTTLSCSCVMSGQAWTWMPVTQTYVISGPVLGQLLGSTSQTAPTTLLRTALLDFSVHRKHVFLALTAFITNPKVPCIDSLMVRGRGLTPSFTQNQLNPRTSRNWFPALPDSL